MSEDRSSADSGRFDAANPPERLPGLPREDSRSPGRWATIGMLTRGDAFAMTGSWLVRGFALVTGIATVLTLKGMQAEQRAASQMLEAVYASYVAVGSHLFTIAPLDEFQLRVPVYNFNEFKRLKAGLDAYITIEGTEYTGTIERLGAMTDKDRWGRDSNYAIVRFRGDGTLGMLGMNADVRLVLRRRRKRSRTAPPHS